MSEQEFVGLLLIGDPHLEGRVPGFRKDDYPRVILEKLAWCLRYAREQSLLPVILGDLFQLPRDNPNWLIGEVLALLDGPVLSIYGNHDCHQDQLDDDDSLSILLKAGKLRMAEAQTPWAGPISGRSVIVGGTSWGRRLPQSFEVPPAPAGQAQPLVFWLAHHDVKVPGYEEQGYFNPREIPGIDVVINGHIHRNLEDVQTGGTLWITPGNISRRARSDASRSHVPAVLRIDVSAAGWTRQRVEVPHRPYDEVFYEEVAAASEMEPASAFVAGLAELQARHTESGAGLMAFLEQNVAQFDADVAAEIMTLAKEVTDVQEE